MSTCLNCNASETKQWQLLDGSWVCDECWLDEMQGRNERLYSQAAALVAQHEFRGVARAPSTARKSRPPAGSTIPGSDSPCHPGAGRNPRVARTSMPKRAPQPRSSHAQCLLCGRLWWNSQRTRCKVCRGLCRAWSDRDLSLQQRISSAYAEPGRSRQPGDV